MSRANTVLKDTFIYSVGNFGSKILSFILLPVYTFFLSKSDLGTYDLILTTTSLFVPLITMQISDATYRWLLDAKDDDKQKKEAITNGLLVITISLIVFSTCFFAILHFIKFDNSVYFLIILVGSCYFPFFQQAIRGLGRNRFYSFTGLLNSFLLLILNIVFLYFLHFGLSGVLITLALSNIIVIIVILLKDKFYRYITIKAVKKLRIVTMLKYSCPLIVNYMSWWIINSSDKYIILSVLGKDANGLYAVATRFPSIILLFTSVFLMSFQDYALKSTRSEDDTLFISKLFNNFLKFQLCFVLLMVPLSPFLIKYLISSSYQEAWKYMSFLYIGVAFSVLSAFVGVGYQIDKKTRAITTTTLIGASINILISFILTSYIGLYAPSIGTLVSFAVIYLIRLRQTKKILPIKVDKKAAYFLLLNISVVVYCVSFNNSVLNFTLVMLSIITGWFFNKNLIIKIRNVIFEKINGIPLIKNLLRT